MNKQKSPLAIKRELALVERLIGNTRIGADDYQLLYGARQAMSWMLGENAAAASKCVTIPKGKGTR